VDPGENGLWDSREQSAVASRHSLLSYCRYTAVLNSLLYGTVWCWKRANDTSVDQTESHHVTSFFWFIWFTSFFVHFFDELKRVSGFLQLPGHTAGPFFSRSRIVGEHSRKQRWLLDRPWSGMPSQGATKGRKLANG
jgi:hypothetical protein